MDWEFDGLHARNGLARFQLVADRQHSRELVVEVRDACDVTGAVELPSQDAGILRYERLADTSASYVGERYHVYQGGCTTYRFDLPGTTGAQTLDRVSRSLAFVSRETLRRQVHDRSDGRLELDPAPRAAARSVSPMPAATLGSRT